MKINKGKQLRINVIHDKDKPLLTETSAVTRRSTKCCEELYAGQVHHNNSIINITPPENRELENAVVFEQDVREAICTLKT